jgi:hypothetical protein
MKLSHHAVATAQVGLSYFFLAGFFACLILVGLGYLKPDIMTSLTAGVQLVLAFWFMRQRASDPPDPPEKPE